MSKLHSLHDLLLHELSDIYSAETQLVDALPKIAAGCTSPKLRKAVEDHLAQTRRHVTRLDQVFTALKAKPSGEVCAGMKGLLAEGSKLLAKSLDATPEVRDAGIVCAAQRVEHYEMAAYGCARTFADALKLDKVSRLLQETLYEEGDTDRLLTVLALTELNPAAQGVASTPAAQAAGRTAGKAAARPAAKATPKQRKAGG